MHLGRAMAGGTGSHWPPHLSLAEPKLSKSLVIHDIGLTVEILIYFTLMTQGRKGTTTTKKNEFSDA